MRLQVLVILLSIITGIIVPSMPCVHDSEGPELGAIDVCDPDNPFMDYDTPCVNEYVCGQLPPAQKIAIPVRTAAVKSAMLVVEDERPPEA